MIEQVLNDIIDEISLEGSEGCTFDQLFTFVENSITKSLKYTPLKKPLRFDDNYKAFIWTQLRNVDQLIFTMNDTIMDPSHLSYQEIKEKTSTIELAIKTAEDSQDRSIYGSLKSEKKNLTYNHKLILGVIAKSRSQGIGQFQLGERLNMDSKVVFYYIKKLDNLGLIVRESAYTDKLHTRIIYLRRFAKQEECTENDMDGDFYRIGTFKNNLLKQLNEAKDHMMTLQDVIKAMGFVTHRNIRWARVKIAQLHDQGVVEKFNAFDGKRHKPSVRLFKPEPEVIQMENKEDVMPAKETAAQELFYRDLPGEYQFYQDIVSSGENGLVRQNLIDKYPHLDPEIFKTFLDNAVSTPRTQECAKYVIHRAEELGGKSRLFRYFDCDGWKKFNEKMGKTIAEPQIKDKIKAPILVEPTSIDQIGKLFALSPSTKIPLKRLQAKKEMELNSVDEDNSDKPKLKKKRTASNTTIITTKEQQAEVQPEVRRGTRSRKKVVTTPVPEEQESTSKRKLDVAEENNTSSSENESKGRIRKSSEVIVFDSTVSLPQPKKAKKSEKSSLLNSTKLRRCNILLDMMEKQRIRELNTDTANEFNEIEKVAAGGQKMAVSTFNKMAKQLHEEKKLKLYATSIQKEFGLTEIKTFLLHPSLSEESEQVKQFIRTYKMERPIMESTAKPRGLKKVTVQKIPSLNEPVIKSKKGNEKGPMESSYAFEYGWIKSKWIRSKELHESLMEYYVFSGSAGHVIDMTEYIKFISLNTLMIIVSNLPYNVEEFRKFVDIEDNRKLSLGDVPEEIRLLVFQSRLRIRFLINHFLQVLGALGVVKATSKTKNEDRYAISPTYILSDKGVIRDYAFKDRTIVKTLPLQSVEDVRIFWEELQSNCVHPARYRTAKDEKELEECADENDPLHHIHRSRGWVVEVVLTPQQKEILDSFIDEKSAVIPSDNEALRIHLMKKTKLTAKRIRAYYTGVMGALLKKQTKEKKEKLRLKKSSSISTDATIKDLMRAALEKRKVDTAVETMKQQTPFALPTYIGSRRVRRLRVRTEPYQGKDRTGKNHASKSTPNLDPLEKDLLLYAYCIMKARAKIGRFFWDPATKLLTDKNKNQCRRAFNAMKEKEPGLLITIERLMYKWEKYFKEGIETQKITDKNPWDTLDYDLPSYVEYFILRLQQEESNVIYPAHILPANINSLNKKYFINRVDPSALQAKKEEHKHTWVVGMFDGNSYDLQPEISVQADNIREVHLIKILIKMLLMTPDHLYNSVDAHTLFSNYPHNVIEEALRLLNEEGLVIKDKSRYGRIPGRAFNVSEKFLKIAEGTLPHGLFGQARSHHKAIVSAEVLELKNIPMNGGVVASTLSLLSQNKISLYTVLSDTYKKLKDSLYYPKVSAVLLQKAFIYKDLEIAIMKNTPISTIDNHVRAQAPDAKITLPAFEQIEVFIQCMKREFPFAKSIYAAIKSSATRGVSLNQIMSYVKKVERKEVGMQLITKTVDKLINHKPPIIWVVGFEQLRYVATEYMSGWLLKTSNDKAFLNPLMWNDVSGKVIQLALDGCANAVISHILTQPGISHANLRKKFEKFFTEYELYNLIKYLTDSKIVLQRKIQRASRPKRVSIFDKGPLISTSNNNCLANSNEVTYYWISNRYYFLNQEE